MVRSSNVISRETCQLQNVRKNRLNIGSEERCMRNVPGPIDAYRHHSRERKRDTRFFCLKRLTGVRALIVAVKRCNTTPWSQGGQEGRYERNKP